MARLFRRADQVRRVPVERHRLVGERSEPGKAYLVGDVEAFVPLNDQLPETFATKWRFRVGPGYTLDRSWRFELLYTHDIARNTLKDDFDADVNAIDLRAHRFF